MDLNKRSLEFVTEKLEESKGTEYEGIYRTLKDAAAKQISVRPKGLLSTCPSCGELFFEDVPAFCPECGQKMQR